MRKNLILPFYLPTFLMAFGSGMLTPILPLYLKSFGVSFGLVSVAMSVMGLGRILSDLPAGGFVQRLGTRRAMLIGSGGIGVAIVAVGLAPLFLEIIFLRFVIGVGMALWNIARHAYITSATTTSERGRSIALFGGLARMGSFAGPAVGGVIAARYGLRTPFFFQAALVGVAGGLVFLFAHEPASPQAAPRGPGVLRELQMVLRHYAHDLATAGSAQMFAQMIRAGRRLIVPLYGAYQLGLEPQTLGVIISLASAVDMLMFYPAGLIMDRAGRKYASVPCFFVLALGMGLLPFAKNAVGLAGVTLLMGLGNGLGSGAMMTLGADLAPKRHTSSFLGAWRLIGDLGNTSGPLVVGNIADLIGLAPSAFVLAGIGFFAAATLFFFVPETLPSGKRPFPP